MSLMMPQSGTEVRDLINVEHLVMIASPENRAKLPTFREAISNAVKNMKADRTVRAVHTYCLRADGQLWLMRVGPRGGWKCEWNFGTL